MYRRRRPRGWRIFWIIIGVVAIMLTGAVLLNNGRPVDEPDAVSTDLRAFFPATTGMLYDFHGEGMEFAPFLRSVGFVDGSYAQMYDDNGGTVMGFVYRRLPDKIELVLSQPEMYDQSVNLIETVDGEAPAAEVLLQNPLVEGNTWESGDQIRQITAVGQTVTVPAGTFYDVVEIKVTSQLELDYVNYEYYAKNIGLIKRDFIAGADESGEAEFHVVSALQTYGLENPAQEID